MNTKKRRIKRASGSVDAEKFLEDLLGPLSIASMIESHRLCEEITHAELARRLGISRANLCDIEQGRKLVSPERAARFACALNDSETLWIQVALEDELRESGFNFKVHLQPCVAMV